MTLINNIHFIRPVLLILLPIGWILIWLLWRRVSSHSNWLKICDPQLVKHLLCGKKPGNQIIPYAGLAVAWCLGVLAMAGPAWEKLPRPMYDQLDGRVIIFDLSRSMDSTDIKPSRLTRAKYKLTDLIQSGSGLQQSLVVFAGDAFVVTPMTDDIDTLTNLIPTLETRTVPVQGSRSDLAIALAISLFEQTGFTQGHIIMLADSVSAETAAIAKTAADKGYRVSVISVGTRQGEPIPLINGEYLKDSTGNIVIPGVDKSAMRNIAEAGNGKFTEMTVDTSDINLISSINQRTNEQKKSRSPFDATPFKTEDNFHSDRWIDHGPWLVIPLLLLAALGFRRGWVLCLCLLMLPFSSEEALAFSWQDLWSRPDQQASRNFDRQSWDHIPENASAEWQGAAKYRLENYQDAIDAYTAGDLNQAVTHYNLGNALAKSHAFEESLAAYDQALEINPELQDAIHNKQIIEEILKSKENQQDQQTSNQNQNQDSDQQQNKKQNNPQHQQDAANQDEQTGSESEGEQQQASNTDQKQDKQNPENHNPDQPEPESFEQQSTENNNDPTEQTDVLNQTLDEQQQAMQQWLQKIPDDPGGLLRRKFAQQYYQRENHPANHKKTGKPW